MKDRGHGHILITGSIAGFMSGTFQAVYNGTKAFLDSFSFALRAELKGSGVTVTCLMPGATETDFFERADMLDTKVGTAKKDDPAEVARTGLDAMMKGDGDVVSGWQNKLQAAIAGVLPAGITAELHRKQAAPGTPNKKYPRRLRTSAVTIAPGSPCPEGWVRRKERSRARYITEALSDAHVLRAIRITQGKSEASS
jgi:NAD(P)-dependent dehydrogenase (short-subunit alcohol dehydrogenase family)